MSRRVAFLDRDGTLNVDRGYVVRREEWEWLPGAIDALRILRDCKYVVALVTNQSAIAAGKYSLPDVEVLHEFVLQELIGLGIAIDHFAICPHAKDEGCACRKPRTGLAGQIESLLRGPIDYSGSLTIGDKPCDVEFGQALGTRTGLIASRYWSPSSLTIQPDVVDDSLYQCVTRLLSG